MVYLKNNTDSQQCFIPRDEAPESVVPTSQYSSGYTDGYQDGYSKGRLDGFSNGQSYQKSLLGRTTFTEDGVYTSENGWSAVTVDANTDGAYADGFADGYASGYTVGYSEGLGVGYDSGVTVGFNSGYTSGHTDGIAYQKSLMQEVAIIRTATPTGMTFENGVKTVYVEYENAATIEINITANGRFEYDPKPTWAAYDYVIVNANVPTDADYASGYTDGYQVGYNTGVTDGYASGITDGYSSGVTVGYASGTTDGYNSGVTDGYASGYTSGYTDGLDVGYDSGVTVGYNSGYTSGYTDGVDWRSAQDIPGRFTENGTYRRSNGYGWIEVNVEVPKATIVTLTQEEYDELDPKDNNTIYLIKE